MLKRILWYSFLFVLPMILMMAEGDSTSTISAASVYYAKPSATGAGNCLSWGNACSLQSALGLSASGDEIWVAQGIHSPGGYETATFRLIDDVAIYGGFTGTETSRDQRNYVTNLTILSGDFNGDDVTTNGVVLDAADQVGNNNRNVVHTYNVTETTILDGFTITGGQDDEINYSTTPFENKGWGGGMYNSSGNPTLRNLIFSGNLANNRGGGMANNNNGNPTLTNVIFSNNTITSVSGYGGGGMYNGTNSNPVLNNVIFSDNSTPHNFGGAILNWYSQPILNNVTISGNSATRGAGMYNYGNRTPVLNNVTMFGNIASYRGGGLYNSGGSTPVLNHVTISGNHTDYQGGAIYIASGNVMLSNVTISHNSDNGGGGGGIRMHGGTLTMQNTIIANNGQYDCLKEPGNTINDQGHNLIERTGYFACWIFDGFNGNIVGQDPDLGDLADNGGVTLTHKPTHGSPVIDKGSCTGIDQRGETRPHDYASITNADNGCDIGAVEVTGEMPPSAPTMSINLTAGATITLNWPQNSANCSYTINRSTKPYTDFSVLGTVSAGPYLDHTGTGASTMNYFYYVTAHSCPTGESSTNSPGFAVFNFVLNPSD